MKIAIRIIAGLAVVGLLGWMASLMTFKEVKVPMPLKGEAARNPFYAAIRFTEELGGEADWERVFTTPPDDAVIFLSAWNWTLGKARRERLEQWVEAGGRLIVDNSMVGGFEEFERWSGVSEQQVEVEANEDEVDDGEEDETESFDQTADEIAATWRERMCHPLAEDGSERSFKVCGVDYSRTLASSRPLLWALRDGRDIHALRTAVGRGSVTVINATPFRYRSFLEADHARLFVRLLQLRSGDTVLFLSEGEADSLLRLLWRYGAPAVLLMAAFIVLALWRAGARFGPPIPATPPARRSLAEQIRGTGQFALRFGGGSALHRAAVRALRDVAVKRFPGYDHMDSETRVAAIAKAAGMSEDDLRPAMNHSGARSSHELRDAIAALELARRSLSAKKENHGKH
jgi:hypothetical protein